MSVSSKIVYDVIGKLTKLQARGKEVGKETAENLNYALNHHLAGREEILKRRYELISGRCEPSADELGGYLGPYITGQSGVGTGLPYFWLNVLISQEVLSESITKRDMHALEFLSDIRFDRGSKGMLVEFYFLENPYFENKVLRRGLYIERNSEGAPVHVRDESTAFEWKEGGNLLIRSVIRQGTSSKKKGKSGKKGGKPEHPGKRSIQAGDDPDEEEEPRLRYRPCPSFFRFFTSPEQQSSSGGRNKPVDPTALDDEEEEMIEEDKDTTDHDHEGASFDKGKEALDKTEMRAKHDGDLLNIIICQVIPRAVHLYLEGPMKVLAGGKGVPQGDDEDGDENEEGYEMVSRGGSHGGDVSALTPHAQQVLHALKGLQAKMDVMMQTFKRAKWEAIAAGESKLQELCDQRKQLLARADGSDAVPSVPNFWLRALKGLEYSVDAIHVRDERALSYLTDVRFKWDFVRPMPSLEDPTRHGTLELSFHPSNPYFSNTILAKRYVFNCSGASIRRLTDVKSSQVCKDGEPLWKEGRDLTVKAVGPDGRLRPAASFFALFKKGALRQAFNITGQGLQAESEARELEEGLVNEIQSRLMSQAVDLYQSVDIDDDIPEGESDDDDDEEEASNKDYDEGEDHEFEEDGDNKRNSSASRGRQQGVRRRGGKGSASNLAASAAAAKAAAMKASSDDEKGLSTILRAAKRNWILTLLAVLILTSVFIVFVDMLQDARSFVTQAGWS
ncbi:hypothetical protein CEUSTIGMA_g11302.t1 [Chlamydomonas eustigma]|uniref:Nucleosome assembly protein n=1 Tax=Chlamydomonas eustigma TaxID=1157962 RepID=A0A250XLC9_9CHLO|nr:hypothetical protein CEUSTIGMA_g11302.t1 [Chlamydomonas eustigma]|eukprot:GAX83877.1 hypothetical protein CEUSTIGMA_g11302.t1 [Chlamydomonas eustigma]